MISTTGNVTRPGCNEVDGVGRDNARTSAMIDGIRIGARMMDTDGLGGVEGKIDIIILDKTIKTPLLISC